MTTKKTPAETTAHSKAKSTTKTAVKSGTKTTPKATTKTATKPAEQAAAAAEAKAPAPASVKPASKAPAPAGSNVSRYALIAVLAAVAFFGAYRFASASSQQGASGGFAAAASGLLPAASGAAGGDGCCGGGGAPVEGAATVEGDVQKIAVDLSTGSYNPNIIKLKAGVPTEITFGASGGCTASVQSADLGFNEDLTSGPKTVKLGALQPGTYNFACGMNMVTGQIVVE